MLDEQKGNTVSPEYIEDELNKVFQNGSVFDASDEDLKRYLRYLSSGHVPNEMVRHREIIRGITINTIKTFRFIDAVERSNQRYSKIVIVLSIVAVLVSLFSIWQSITSSRQMERLINIQQEQLVQMRGISSSNQSLNSTQQSGSN